MKSHSFDGISFFSGLVIAAIGLLFLIPASASEVLDAVLGVGVWFWPVLFLTIGLGVIIPVLIPKKEKEADEVAKPES